MDGGTRKLQWLKEPPYFSDGIRQWSQILLEDEEGRERRRLKESHSEFLFSLSVQMAPEAPLSVGSGVNSWKIWRKKKVLKGPRF